MAKTKDDRDELFDDNGVLKNGRKLRTPMWAMDARSIRNANVAYAHRPGYRVGQQLLTDSKTREALADAYSEYETTLTNAWKNTPPEPVINTKAAAVIDSDFDDEWTSENMYDLYNARLQDEWRSK